MNCKPGDLAIVIRASRPENIGLIVEVIEVYTNQTVKGRGFRARVGTWWCKTKGSNIKMHTLKGEEVLVDHAAIHDACLRPVSGLSDEDVIVKEKELEQKTT